MNRPLRLMTWNLRSLRDDRSAVIEALKRISPDVLFVQETPRFFRAGSKLAALGRESGLVVACRGGAGVGLLTSMRVDVDLSLSTSLPRTRGLHQRALALACLHVGGRRCVAASTHLGLDKTERLRHATIIRDLLDVEPQLPLVLGGDMNETSAADAWQLLAANRADTGAPNDWPTFPAREPKKRIDTIFVPADWRTVSVSPTEIVDDALLVRATDHRPAIVDVVD